MNDLKLKFFTFLNGEESISTFEEWLYATPDLEAVLSSDDYLLLISLDFSETGICSKIEELIKQYVDVAEYETWRLRKLLNKVIDRDSKFPEILSEFYELYCHGYGFLDSLGLSYGLPIRVPPQGYSADTWEELSKTEQNYLLDSLSEGAIDEARKVLFGLDTQKIILTNQLNHYGVCPFV
ncbi:MAG: hypothetical protein LDL41_04520 [Coleofasciculus sp. S288]|nr:hypothetical protein [Coleofasciculus sp. S288]